MRLFVLFFLFFSLLMFSAFTFPVKLSEDLQLNELKPDVFVATHSFPWPSNSLIVQSDREVVLIDTPYDPVATELLIRWIKVKFNPQKITAIITGFHVDNLGGNEYLLSEGIDVYGADLTSKLIAERSETTRNKILSFLQQPEQKRFYQVHKNIRFLPANKQYSIEEGMTYKSTKYDFEVYYPGPSHTNDNVVVYIPQLKVLFGGCMILSKEASKTGFIDDANMNEWPLSVQKVKARFSEAEIVVPHHGACGDSTLFEHTIAILKKEIKID